VQLFVEPAPILKSPLCRVTLCSKCTRALTFEFFYFFFRGWCTCFHSLLKNVLIYIRISTRIYIHTYVCIHICIFIYTHTHIHIHIYQIQNSDVCLHTHTHTHTHTHQGMVHVFPLLAPLAARDSPASEFFAHAAAFHDRHGFFFIRKKQTVSEFSQSF
jgi:hypothetical protein